MSVLSAAIAATIPRLTMDPATSRSIAAGIARVERTRQAEVTAKPMRELFDMLAQGEVYEVDGVSVMHMPETGDEHAAWCAVGPAIRGWIDLWARIAPDIGTRKLQYLADRIDADKPITPRLVEQARAEFDATVQRLVDIPPGQVTSAIRTTEIAWEIEKLQRGAAA